MKEIDEKIEPLYDFLTSPPSAPAREALNKFLKEKNLKIIEPKRLPKFVTKALNLYEINDRKGCDKLMNDVLRHVGALKIGNDVNHEFLMFVNTCHVEIKSLPRNVKTYVPDHEALNKILRKKNLKIIEPDFLNDSVTDALNLCMKKDSKGYNKLINDILLHVGFTQMTCDVINEFSTFCSTCFDEMGYTPRLEKLPWKAPWK